MAELVDSMVASYQSDDRTHHLDSTFLPNRARTIEIVELLRRLIFPGFFDDERLTSDTIHEHVRDLLCRIQSALYEQMRQALRYEANRSDGPDRGDGCEDCDEQARDISVAFLKRIPTVRHRLTLDIQAAFTGDPAAAGTDEIIFCYPGCDAVFIHRIAHELYQLKVPMLPRIMSEYAHNETGIDIHPGAQIGDSFFIDHGTGVVIGETTVIGDRVTLYQGVTLGALSTKGGQTWRGRKRHPTIEDDVTIYGGAIIVGGGTVIGHGATIGGAVFLTRSVPAEHSVSMNKPDLVIRPKKRPRIDQAAP